MELNQELQRLRNTMAAGNAYAQIADMALGLAEVEALVMMQVLVPGLTGVTVECSTETDGDNTMICIDQFTLHIDKRADIVLYHVDADDLIADAGRDLHELTLAIALMPAPEDIIEKIELFYTRLNDLPRLRGVRNGVTRYDLSSVPDAGEDKLDQRSSGDADPTKDLLLDHPNLTRRNTWVIYSATEAASDDDKPGFWSNEFGWTSLDASDRWFGGERMMCTLPTGVDVEWRRLVEFEVHGLAASLADDLDTSGLSSLEYRGVQEVDGVLEVNDSDPLFYALFGMAADERRVLGRYVDTQPSMPLLLRKPGESVVPLNFSCGDMDHWFMAAINARLRSATPNKPN